MRTLSSPINRWLYLLLAGVLAIVEAAALRAAPLVIDGSSTVYPITEAMAEEFELAVTGGPEVRLGISGTTAGFRRFCRGEIDIADASRPINRDELEACRKAGVAFIELPVAFDAVTVVVNKANTWARALSMAELKKLWEPAAEGVITRWSNLREGWPQERIALFMPGRNSGTYDYFTAAVVGEAGRSRRDWKGTEDVNMLVKEVARDPYALGFFGYAYYADNADRVRAIAINAGNGPVLPSERTVLDGSYRPLSRPIFIYVRDAVAHRSERRAFVSYYLEHAARVVMRVGNVPLPETGYALVRARFNQSRLGSVFGGQMEVGLTIEELLKLERGP
ncbi:MAG: PstS family phosphate ABC transporter substrate-binding protein [Thiobacillaceae bacterium]